MTLKQVTDLNNWNQKIIDYSTPAVFLQSWEWGEFQKTQGYGVERLGLFDTSGQILALLSLIRRDLWLGRFYLWYCPHGPVIFNQANIVAVVGQLVGLIPDRYNKAVMLRLTPAWAGSDVNWSHLGFREPEILIKQREPERTWLTDLSQSEEALLEQMHHKTRYNIRLAARKGVIFKLQPQALALFYQLLRQTAKRGQIKFQSYSYYEALLSQTELITNFDGVVDHNKLTSVLGFSTWQKKELAGGIWLGFGDRLTYLYGASSREHKQVMASHFMHWAMIKWAQAKGFKYYDWWGIDDSDTPFALKNISRFKQGFAGRAVSFSGAHDYVYQPLVYNSIKWLKKIKDRLL